MIYYLDGYNYLFTRGKKEDPLHTSREEVLDEFSERTKDLNFIVVFDAHHNPHEISRTYYKNLEVVYTSQEQTADEYILERVSLAKVPYNITVISNDKKLLNAATELKARIFSFEKFLKKISRTKRDFNDKSNSKKFNSYDQDHYYKKFTS